MTGGALDPLALGQRVAHLLESGRREATYKLATLRALVEFCVEQPAVGSDAELDVPFHALAHRVIAAYWQQTRPYGSTGVLRQTNRGAGIVEWIAAARESPGLIGRSADAARASGTTAYARLAHRVADHIARYPLAHLQHVSGAAATAWNDDFLFDSAGLHKRMPKAAIVAMGGVRLRPGVAHGLAVLAPMLVPVVHLLWVDDVVRMNAHELDVDPLPSFLFGADRTALTRLVGPLRALQDDRCFYCDDRFRARADVEVDHVLPWSRIPIDGVANLVLADRRCNAAKSASMPDVGIFHRALGRHCADLRSVGADTGTPVLHGRTLAAGLGLYQGLPDGSPLWLSIGTFSRHARKSLDVVWREFDVELGEQ